jgi:hypothetical protein
MNKNDSEIIARLRKAFKCLGVAAMLTACVCLFIALILTKVEDPAGYIVVDGQIRGSQGNIYYTFPIVLYKISGYSGVGGVACSCLAALMR